MSSSRIIILIIETEMINLAKRNGANAVEPIRELRKIQELKRYLLQRSYRDYFLFTFGINSGLRISDILPLKVIDVLNKTHLIIREKKTGNTRKTLISNLLKQEIEDYTRSMSKQDYLFKSQKGNHPISRIQAWHIINTAARECNVEGSIGTHTLRKTFGYHFYQSSKDVAMLQYIFGHSSPAITLRYIGINDDMVDEALKNFSL